MNRKRVVLVTGAAGFWGSRVAAELAGQPELHVIGLDDRPPVEKINGLDFIQADIRNTLLPSLLREERVNAVCHLAFVESARPSESAFDLNVMGTAKVLAACAEAHVRQVVLKSSTMVYGAQPTNSAYLREDRPLRGTRGYGYVRDLIEIEAFCNGFRGQAPRLALTILRFAHIVGPQADTPLTRFLREAEAPVLLGFDPMMQIIHEADVVAALVHAMLHRVPGTFNVASDGVMPLWRLIGLADKVSLPVLHPLAYLGASLFGQKFTPLELDYLRYPCVGDLTQMKSTLKFTAQRSADEALRECAAAKRLSDYAPAAGARTDDEERLRETLDRRARARARANGHTSSAPAPTRRRPTRGGARAGGQSAAPRVQAAAGVPLMDLDEAVVKEAENGNA